MTDGSQVPYLVAGAGGYYNLHHIMKVNGETMIPPVVFPDKGGDPVTLERYCADHHGFLRMEITDKLITGHYYAVPRPQDPYSKGNQLLDYFEFDWKNRRYIPNTLPTPDPARAASPTASVVGKRVMTKRSGGGKPRKPVRKRALQRHRA